MKIDLSLLTNACSQQAVAQLSALWLLAAQLSHAESGRSDRAVFVAPMKCWLQERTATAGRYPAAGPTSYTLPFEVAVRGSMGGNGPRTERADAPTGVAGQKRHAHPLAWVRASGVCAQCREAGGSLQMDTSEPLEPAVTGRAGCGTVRRPHDPGAVHAMMGCRSWTCLRCAIG
jgi:hypothetical protein